MEYSERRSRLDILLLLYEFTMRNHITDLWPRISVYAWLNSMWCRVQHLVQLLRRRASVSVSWNQQSAQKKLGSVKSSAADSPNFTLQMQPSVGKALTGDLS
jgi:hypothetical protein